MPPRSDRSLSRRDSALFAACLVASVLMLVRPAWGDATAGAIRRSVLVPFLQLQEWSEASRTSRAAFDVLRAERDSAAYAAQFLPALRSENQRLRSLLSLGTRLTVPYRAAEVLHQSVPTDGRTMLLSIGSRQGVKEFAPVIGPDGLLGVVRTVERERSLAMTWAHPEFRASAFALSAGVFGVVRAALQVTGSEQLLQLRGVAIRDSVPIGTLVVTSGLGGVYPPGIPVGTVVGQAQEETGWERIYVLHPAASPEAATQVLVLLGATDSSLATLFTGDSLP
jgi:rod shape-determining protein MreC